MSEVYIIEKAPQNQVIISLDSKLLQNGIVLINGEIDEEMEAKVKSQIFYLINNLKTTKKISIHISSYGGSVYSGLAIYDMIEYAKNKGFIIETICTGVAMSMGLVLLSAGSKNYRKAMPNCTMMGHTVHSSNGLLSSVDYTIQYNESTRLNNIMMNIIKSNSNIKNPEDFFNRDTYLTSNDCIKLNLIDNIC